MELANDRDIPMKLVKREPTPNNILPARTLRNEAKLAFKRIREEFIKSKLEERVYNYLVLLCLLIDI